MASDQVNALNRNDILKTAKDFQWSRQLPPWTTIVSGKELPARPLVLQAADVPPNDKTNSHAAVKKLNDLGFETRYNGRTTFKP